MKSGRSHIRLFTFGKKRNIRRFPVLTGNAAEEREALWVDERHEIQYLKGVGPKRAALYERLGIRTVEELLRFYPRAYEDYSSPIPIAKAQPGETCCIRAVVGTPVRENLIRRGMTLYKLRVADDTGVCAVTFFNNRFVKDRLRQGEEYLFYGRMGGTFLKREMLSPNFEPAGDGADGNGPGLRPIYPLTAGLSSRAIAAAERQALRLLGETLPESLPESLRARFGLSHIRYAVENVHFPRTPDDLAAARRRLAFEELFLLSLGMRTLRRRREAEPTRIRMHAVDFGPFYAELPFAPTGAQRRAIREAAEDMTRTVAMNRLLQGDVGSGKTLVAAALCYFARQNGCQSALMAPTEILAQQHLHSLTALLAPFGLRVGLLTGSLPAAQKQAVREQLAGHTLDLVVGTHALLQEDVAFDRLGLVVTDEQHRFGVGQRAVLGAKGQNPHVLVMSATPIPRTLSLMVYGDLDISVLDEMPAGRRPVRTYLVDSSKRKRIYAFIRRHLDQGLQAYIVCPLVEQAEGEGEEATAGPGGAPLADVESYADRVAREEFSAYRVGLLHGRLRAQEKERIMGAFSRGELDVLVSTTVIEVGVDVPNAAVMVVENAERFGLSQLHQLRGRVGRGAEQSSCILITDSHSRETLERLKTLRDFSDGFKVAEKDLQLRGPGDFFGHRQHGLPELRIADLFSDLALLHEAQQAAEQLLDEDPLLEQAEYRPLRAAVSRLFEGDVVFN
jgi:ATP-dependent DNA helicase RecG